MLHIEGFEQFNNEDPITNALERSGYVVDGQWTSVAGRGRFSRALSGAGCALRRIIPWTQPHFTLGFAHKFAGRGSVCWLRVGTQDITLSFDRVTGLPLLGTTVGGAIPTINRYYYIELHVYRDSGSIELSINGKFDSTFIVGSLVDADSVEVNFGYRDPAQYLPPESLPATDTAVKSYDDFYAREFPPVGPVMITTRFPTHDEAVTWQKAGESSTHAGTVGLTPAAPLDRYLATDQYDQSDIFSSSQAMSNDHPVIATGMIALTRRSPAFPALLNVAVDDLGSAVLPVDGNWVMQYAMFDERVDDPAGIVASQFSITAVNP